MGCECTRPLLFTGSFADAGYLLEAGVPVRTVDAHIPSLAYTLEDLRPLFSTRASSGVRRNRVARNGPHARCARVQAQAAAGRAQRAAVFIRSAVAATEGVPVIAVLGATSGRWPILPAE